MTRIRLPLLLLLLLHAPALEAQGGGTAIHPEEVLVGSEAERYMRVLQVAGVVELHPWTLRGLNPRQVRELYPTASDHPWSARFSPPDREAGGLRIVPVSPRAGAIYNSAFPHGSNDGAVWSGRGATGTIEGGFAASWGPVDLTVAPTAFMAQNDGFDLAPTGASDDGAFRDPREPGNIDLPQRFGNGSLERVDPGSSSLHLYLPGTVVGFSTAAQWYGPALQHPLIMGNNAGGFPHAFVGTGRPLDLWLFRLHGRLMTGRLDQSDFAPALPRDETRRVGSAAVLVLVPRGVDGLEIGTASFAHTLWPEDGVGADEILRPLKIEFAGGRRNDDEGETNHIISAFFRWTVPDAGIEFYGEFVREDWQPDARDLFLRPDDLSGYMLGLQKVWRRGPTSLTVFRGELVNTRWHPLQRGHRGRGGRTPFPLYVHSQATQGHTHRGQLLVSPAAYGGSGTTLGVDFYDPRGRWSVELERVVLADRHRVTGLGPTNVQYSLALEGVRFLGDFEVTGRVEPMIELNRHLVEDEDVFNLHVGFGLAYR